MRPTIKLVHQECTQFHFLHIHATANSLFYPNLSPPGMAQLMGAKIDMDKVALLLYFLSQLTQLEETRNGTFQVLFWRASTGPRMSVILSQLYQVEERGNETQFQAYVMGVCTEMVEKDCFCNFHRFACCLCCPERHDKLLVPVPCHWKNCHQIHCLVLDNKLFDSVKLVL